MKNRFLLTALLSCSVLIVFADPAPRDSFMITQPDGTSLWLYECGDEGPVGYYQYFKRSISIAN